METCNCVHSHQCKLKVNTVQAQLRQTLAVWISVFMKASRQMESEEPWSNRPNCVREKSRPVCHRWEKHGMSSCQQLIPVNVIHGKPTTSWTESITRPSCLNATISYLIKQRQSTDINHVIWAFKIIMPSTLICAAVTIALKSNQYYLWVCNEKSSWSTGIQLLVWPGGQAR